MDLFPSPRIVKITDANTSQSWIFRIGFGKLVYTALVTLNMVRSGIEFYCFEALKVSDSSKKGVECFAGVINPLFLIFALYIF